MQLGMCRFSGGETTSRPNIDTFGQYFRTVLSRNVAQSRQRSWRREFYIFVPSLGLPKTTARVGSSSSTAEKKAVRRHGVRSLIVYSTPSASMSKWCDSSDVTFTKRGRGNVSHPRPYTISMVKRTQALASGAIATFSVQLTCHAYY